MSDVELRGSMSRRSSRGIHPIQEPSPSPPPAHQMAYIQTEHKSRSPFLIPLFSLVIIVLFIVTMFINNCPSTIIPGKHCVIRFLGRLSFQPMSENPLLGPSSSTLVKMGALESDRVAHHQKWRLLTCMWLHAGVFHLLTNLLSLLFIGIRLELEFGFLRIGIIYLLSGFGGSLLSALFLENRISVGASGALFGLLGAMLSELIINWTIYTNKCASLTTLVLIVAVNLGVGILPHVDNFAHIGGFVSGFLLGFIFLVRPQFGWVDQRKIPPGFVVERPVKSKHKTYQYIFWIVAFIAFIVGFTFALIMVLRGENANDHCSWCHYLSCVPTSRWSCNEGGIKCESTTQNSTLILTCQSTNKTQSFEGLASDSSFKIRQLCVQLCS